MPTVAQTRIAVADDWVDIVAGNAALSGVNVLIQNLDDDVVDVVAGVASKPGNIGPIRIDTYDSVQVNAANIWVRGSGYISATLV